MIKHKVYYSSEKSNFRAVFFFVLTLWMLSQSSCHFSGKIASDPGSVSHKNPNGRNDAWDFTGHGGGGYCAP